MKIPNDNYVKITTQRVVLDYPHLINPYSNYNVDNGKSKFSSTIIISKDDDVTLQRIDDGIKETISRYNLKQANLHLPLQDGDVKHPYDILYQNSMYLYASSEIQPQLVDTKLQEITYKYDEFSKGTYAKVTLLFVPYDYNNKYGISVKLGNVQIFPQNKLLESRSKPEDDFEVEDVDGDEM